MKKEVIIVPKDKSLFEILANLGEQTANAWIYIHGNVLRKLKQTCNRQQTFLDTTKLTWEATAKNPDVSIWLDNNVRGVWSFVTDIETTDVAFTSYYRDPKEIFFLKMEE